MPVIDVPDYRAPFPWLGGHLQTLASGLSRGLSMDYERERIYTPDGDFLDLDWLRLGSASRGLAIIAHGLEGHSRRPYVMGMARAFHRRGYDVLAWNFRGCSGEPNRKLRFYHSGSSDDLHCVVEHAVRRSAFDGIVLVGFSLGGNICLKYLGEQPAEVPPAVRGAITLSVPCDLEASADRLAEPANTLYLRRFLRAMRRKVRGKDKVMPGRLNMDGIDELRDFAQFDERFTAPMNGFASARDYWRACSSRQFLPGVSRPTLIVNAANDPFLPPSCYPLAEAGASSSVCLEIPRHGGHVGFPLRGDLYWSEVRALHFAAEVCR